MTIKNRSKLYSMTLALAFVVYCVGMLTCSGCATPPDPTAMSLKARTPVKVAEGAAACLFWRMNDG